MRPVEQDVLRLMRREHRANGRRACRISGFDSQSEPRVAGPGGYPDDQLHAVHIAELQLSLSTAEWPEPTWQAGRVLACGSDRLRA